MGSGVGAGRVALVAGTANYASDHLKDLPQIPEALRDVVAALSGAGYRPVLEEQARPGGFLLDPDDASLLQNVRKAAAAGDPVVVYYTGHGMKPDRAEFVLASANSDPASFPSTAVAPRQVVQALVRRDPKGGPLPDSQQPTVMLILDACYAGEAGLAALRAGLEGVGNSNVWLIASTDHAQEAEQRVFAHALARALASPDVGPSQEYLYPEDIVEQVNEVTKRSADQRARCWPPSSGATGKARFFPNPLYVLGLAGRPVLEQHWWAKIRGGPGTGAGGGGFYLTGQTGRRAAVDTIADWMADPNGPTLAVVTGSPGSGKSALVSLPVLLNTDRNPILTAVAPTSLIGHAAQRFPTGTQLAGIHARRLTTDQIAERLAAWLGPRQAGAPSAVSAEALLAQIAQGPAGPPRVLVVDAIDEALDPATLLDLLHAVTTAGRIRVLVGTRRHVLHSLGGAPAALAPLIVDLDTPEYQDPAALVDYVAQLLRADHEPGVVTDYTHAQPDTTIAVADRIAQRATSARGVESFLLAGVLALAVRRHPPSDASDSRGLMAPALGGAEDLAEAVGAVIDEDLARLGDHQPAARALLTALAWANGPGLPRPGIWIPVAHALAGHLGVDPACITDHEVTWLLNNAASYIVEDLGAGGRSVYRPFHELLSAHLRHQPSDEQLAAHPDERARWEAHQSAVNADITSALIRTVPTDRDGNPDWAQSHPYLRTHLAQHAHTAGPLQLSTLVSDIDFLATADTVTLTPVLTPITGDQATRTIARIYRRALPTLSDDPHINAAVLQEATRTLTGQPPTRQRIPPAYRTLLASARQDDSLLTLTGHTDSVGSVAFGVVGGRTVLATGSWDATVRLWDPGTGNPIGRPLTGHTDLVTSVAFGVVDGRTVLATSSRDGKVRLWDPGSGTPIGRPLTGHTGWVWSVAFGVVDGRTVLATGSDDGTVRLWDPGSGTPIGQPLTRHTSEVTSVAFGVVDGRTVLATGSRDETVRLWDPGTGTQIGQPLTGHTDVVTSVAFGVVDGRTVLTSGSRDGTVRLWDPGTGTPIGRPLTGHTDGVESVAFGVVGGRTVLASGSYDQTVRLWDPATGNPIGQPLTGHTGPVASVAFGVVDGRTVLATGSRDRTVRLCDPATGNLIGRPLIGHTLGVLSVAFGVVDKRTVLASGSWDRTVRLWDPGTGTLIGRPLARHTGWVWSVAFGVVDGRTVLASGSDDGTVRLWDPGSGTPIGTPLWHTDGVTSVAFGVVDGRTVLATGSDDGTVRLWDPGTGTGTQIGPPLAGHTGGVTSVAFGVVDGRTVLATGSHDRTVRLWELPAGRTLRLVNRRAITRSIDIREGLAALASDEGLTVMSFQ